MSKSIKLKNNNYIDSDSITHNRKTLKNIINDLGVITTTIETFELTEGNSYQCTIPSDTIFCIPLLLSNGSEYSGSQILIIGSGYSYFTNTSYRLHSEYNGIYLSLSKTGVLNYSSYHSCGTIVKGMRYVRFKK